MCIGGHLWGRCCRPHIPIHIPHPPGGGAYVPPHHREEKREPVKPVPLAGVVVSTKIVDFVAEVTIHQRYENVEDVPIEATYVFPLAEGASVCSFYAVVDGKKIEGKIKEKEKAKDQYDDAIASGHSAYLLEEVEDKKNVFKTSIGNLPPKEEVIITIVYVTELTFTEDKKLEFVIPTNTQAYPDGVQVPRFFQPTKKAPQHKDVVVPPFGLKVDVSFDMTSKIRSISSPSHPIEFNAGDTPNTATVSLANQDDIGVPLLKNFEMKITLANPDTPVFRVQDGVGMLALYPNLLEDDEDPITEMIFLVDRSGSMSGAKIQRVKDTLHIFLRSLPLGTLFNIVGFGSNYVTLFKDGSKEYDDTTLAEATKHVNELKANLGGTSLLPPLKQIFSLPVREGIPRQVFVLTDGEVDNTDDCINYVREHSTSSRVFAFGIHGASPELVNGIAKAGEGKAEIIAGNENVESKVMVQLKRALQPALTDMRIDWGSLAATQTPFKLPPLFSGSRLIVYGQLADNAAPGTVVFSAKSVKGPYKFEHAVTADDLKPVGGFNFIPKLAARSMIRDLEEGRSSYHAQSSFQTADAKKKIIDLSTKSGMLSKYTAFIAVNENNKAIESEMQTRDVNKQIGDLSAQKQRVSNTGGVVVNYGAMRMSSVSTSTLAAAPAAPQSRAFFGGGRGGGGGYGGMSRSGSAGAALNYDDGSSDDEEEQADRYVAPSYRKSSPTNGAGDRNKLAKKKSISKDKDEGASKGKSGSWGFSAKKEEKKESEDRRERSAPKSLSYSAAPPSRPIAPASSMPISSHSSSPISSFSSSYSSPSSSAQAEQSMQAPSAAQSGLRELVQQQKAAGNFTEEALKLTGGAIDKLRSSVPDQLKAIDASLLDQILITAFVCGVLKTKYKAEADQWSLVEKKAIAWIKKEVKKANLLADFDWNAFALKLAK